MPLITAAVCHAHGEPLRIEQVELRAPGPGEVEVTIGAVAICHSDIAYAQGSWGGSLPAVYGHEAAGTVSAIGAGVTAAQKGDRVIVTLIRACGECAPCCSGKPTGCAVPYDGNFGPLKTAQGGTLHQAMAMGAFAEKIVVDASQIAVIPETVPIDAASLLACGVITGVGAVVNTAALRPGQDAVIIGAGGVGLNAIQGARIAGARRIVAVDLLPEKLDVAMEFGATHGVLASGDAPWDDAHAALGKGADAVFVTVGVVAAFDAAIKYLAPGGRVIIVGMPPVGASSSYEPVNFAYYGHGIAGSSMGDSVIRRDIPWLVDLYLQGRLKLDELISRRWSLSEINEAIADTKTGAARRNVIVF